MKRLTIRNSDGSHSQPTDLRFHEVFERLAEYEDTGLSPSQIMKIKAAYPDLEEEVSRIKYEADNTAANIRQVIEDVRVTDPLTEE